MKYRLIVLSCVFSLVMPVYLAAEVVDQAEVQTKIKDILLQWTSAMNLRQKEKIKSFLQYYASTDAIFTKKSIVVDGKNENKKLREKQFSLNRDEYIGRLSAITTHPVQYSFDLQVKNFNFYPNSTFVIVETAIEENEITRVYSSSDGVMHTRLVVFSNCNISFDVEQPVPVIVGSHCIEKVILQ